jgi:glycosyltransferase involved in cell wall biosynthesis
MTRPKITGIMPTYNLIQGQFAFVECILLTLPFVDELLINDGISRDGTSDVLRKLATLNPKIKIIREGHFHGEQWEAIDSGIHACLFQATGDWIVEVQADEFFHPDNHVAILKEIQFAHDNGYNAIRTRRMDITFTNMTTHDPNNYRIIRIFRNLPTVRSKAGGDHFYFIDGYQHPKEPYATHNLPPEWESEILMYHFHQVTPYAAVMANRMHVDFYDIENIYRGSSDERETIIQEILNQRGINPKSTIDELKEIDFESFSEGYGRKVDFDPKLPFILQGLAYQRKYQVREELYHMIRGDQDECV